MTIKDRYQELISLALHAREQSYSPYSNYKVGAALLADSGKIYLGTNVENAAISNTICAERTAIVQAVYEGERNFEIIAVTTRDGGAPCGNCRQVLAEFGTATIVLIADEHGKLITETTVKELLPYSFGPSNLQK